MLPPGFDIDEMEVNSFDVEAVREGSKKTIPKLKLKLTWTFIYIVDYLNNCSSLGMYSLIISSTSLTHTKKHTRLCFLSDKNLITLPYHPQNNK